MYVIMADENKNKSTVRTGEGHARELAVLVHGLVLDGRLGDVVDVISENNSIFVAHTGEFREEIKSAIRELVGSGDDRDMEVAENTGFIFKKLLGRDYVERVEDEVINAEYEINDAFTWDTKLKIALADYYEQKVNRMQSEDRAVGNLVFGMMMLRDGDAEEGMRRLYLANQVMRSGSGAAEKVMSESIGELLRDLRVFRGGAHDRIAARIDDVVSEAASLRHENSHHRKIKA